MKNPIIKLVPILLFATLTIFSCAKDDSPSPVSTSSGTPITPVTPISGTFTWSEDGGAIITADSAFWTTGTWGTGLRVYKGGYANFFEINWATQDNISVGAKVLDITNYGFTFMKGSSTYSCTTNQNLNITASASNKIDGNFNVPVTGGTITTISAAFTGLTKQ
jgi:hypothetical protein